MTARRELANCTRALSMDAVQRANSGHPRMPMGMADIAQVLWSDTVSGAPAAALAQKAPQATRQSSQATLNAIAPRLPAIMGGSADLTGSNNTRFKTARELDPKEGTGDLIH